MTLQPGSRLGTYEIVDLLGVGGMGEVYRANDRKLGRAVAIKVLPEEFAREPARVSRFEREARMLAAVNHPTIAAIYGAEEDGATRYIVMELVEGETLAQRLATGPLSVADALRVGSQIAEALEIAHEKGVIHRDLKPANIKLTPGGKVKVLDFGLAKAMEIPFVGDMSRSPTLVMSDSRPGEIVGTPEFMSPEQARGKETDRRTDIWSFGCILYESLTGERAFTGETVPDAVGAILHLEPDWSKLPARTPERVRELLRLCLEKDPGRRLRDAGDARLEIESALATMSGAGGTPAGAGPPARWATGLLGAAAIALAVSGYLFFRSRQIGTATAPALRQLAVLPFRNLTGSAQGELMGAGLSETVAVRLANVNGLQVVTPRAAADAADEKSSFDRVARKLGANTLLAGTLQRENDLFRITYRLLDANGNQIAAGALDGSELFALQDRIAERVAADLRLKGGLRRTPTPSGLDTPALQERYVEAIGLLQRYDRRERVEKALASLTQLAREKPESPLVQAAIARADLAMMELTSDQAWATRALAASDAARALDPSLPDVDVTLGRLKFETGRPAEAAAAYRRALAARPGDVEALIGLGRASEALGDRAAADAAFRRAVELQPSFAVFNQLGAVYYARGSYSEAAEMFQRATRAAPDSAWAFSNLGGTEATLCNYPAAMEAYRRALGIDAKDATSLSNLGMTQLWTGHTAEGVASLERAARESPEDFMVAGNLGDAYRVSGDAAKAQGEWERAMALARARLTVNPQDVYALCYVASGLARTGHANEGAAAMAKLTATGPREVEILAEAAVVSALAGHDDEALAWIRRAVAAGYCRDVVLWQPEFNRFHDKSEFRAIVAAPQRAAGS